MAASKRILIIVTSTERYEKVGFRTGLWLGELTHFWDVVEKEGYQMDLASPAGGRVPIDPESLLLAELGDAVGLKGPVSKRYEDAVFMRVLDASTKIADVDHEAYDAIYLTGGHGTMFDFPTSAALASLIARFYEAGKVVSAVCHGPAGLLEVKLAGGEHLLQGKRVTGFSWKEEIAARRDHAVPFSLEEELGRRGGTYDKALLPFASHVVEDGRLVTGQNPGSAKGVAGAVVKLLRSAT